MKAKARRNAASTEAPVLKGDSRRVDDRAIANGPDIGDDLEGIHRPLTDEQLSDVEEQFDLARKRPGSLERLLPHDAGHRLRTALPLLLKECDRQLFFKAPLPIFRTWVAELDRADRDLQAAAAALRRVVSLPSLKRDQAMHLDYYVSLGALTQMREVCAARRGAYQMRIPRPGRRGRRMLPWRELMLTIMAAWWFRQGWQPTQQRDGCFLTVARLLRDFRTANREKDKDFNAQTIANCIRSGRKLASTL